MQITKQVKLFTFVLVALFLSFYVYKNVLPYSFPLQYEPTQAEVEQNATYNANDQTGIWHGEQVTSSYFPDSPKSANVLGANTEKKRIEVDLTNQRVYAYEGDTKVYDFLVSTGKWGSTPTGNFTIAYKNRVQKMTGGSKILGTYYYLPNVQFVQFFANDQIPWSMGFSFHGTYWHHNFGHPMSHGCVNMTNKDAEILYNWTTPDLTDKNWVKATDENPGTPVLIYGQAPLN